jgi:hypothetical protein
MLAGGGLLALFVVLDLAVTWPNYAALITLGEEFTGAGDDAERVVVLGAAKYAVAVLSSGYFAAYAILLPGAGIGIIGLVMLKAGFGRLAGYLAVATGVLAVLAVVSPLFADAGDIVSILASVFTMCWVLVTGYKLLRLS